MAGESAPGGLARSIASGAKTASPTLAVATTESKNRVLERLADLLDARESMILEANRQDVDGAREAGSSAAMLDRLTLDSKRVGAMARAIRDVVALPDPVGELTETHERPNGLNVRRVRIPLGVIFVIYEARPNVTADAAALCLKSGNAVVLRGGKEAMRSNRAIARLIGEALSAEGLPPGACQLVENPDRALLLDLLEQADLIDLAIPRGGEGLIRFVAEHARVPVVKHYKGVCHLYVHRAADLEMAARLAFNGKVSRPGVCNALECLLVDAEVSARALPLIALKLSSAGVELHADERALPWCAAAKKVVPATEDDFGREFLSLDLAVKVVDGYDEALAHIARYGSQHTEVICTEDHEVASRFTREVDASMVGWNVSTRFNDGGELGLGAEIGISTSKVHAFGPMGLRELTTTKFVVTGQGQVR